MGYVDSDIRTYYHTAAGSEFQLEIEGRNFFSLYSTSNRTIQGREGACKEDKSLHTFDWDNYQLSIEKNSKSAGQ